MKLCDGPRRSTNPDPANSRSIWKHRSKPLAAKGKKVTTKVHEKARTGRSYFVLFRVLSLLLLLPYLPELDRFDWIEQHNYIDHKAIADGQNEDGFRQDEKSN